MWGGWAKSKKVSKKVRNSSCATVQWPMASVSIAPCTCWDSGFKGNSMPQRPEIAITNLMLQEMANEGGNDPAQAAIRKHHELCGQHKISS